MKRHTRGRPLGLDKSYENRRHDDRARFSEIIMLLRRENYPTDLILHVRMRFALTCRNGGRQEQGHPPRQDNIAPDRLRPSTRPGGFYFYSVFCCLVTFDCRVARLPSICPRLSSFSRDSARKPIFRGRGTGPRSILIAGRFVTRLSIRCTTGAQKFEKRIIDR